MYIYFIGYIIAKEGSESTKNLQKELRTVDELLGGESVRND